MADISSVVKFFPTASETFEDNLSSSIAAGATIVPVNSAVEYANGDLVVLTVEPGTSNEATFVGEKNGNQFENCVWTEGNTGVGHASGATVIDYIAATHLDIMSEGILKEHNPNGTHKNINADALNIAGVSISQLLPPTGSVMSFAGGAAPTGWLLCDGTAVSRSTYATLFSAIGTAYGVGDGSTTFNLPSTKGRVIAGKDVAQVEFDNLGDTGGAKTHFHWQTVGSDGGNAFVEVNGAGSGHTRVITVNRATWGVGGAAVTSSRGEGTYDESSLQPFVTMNHIIKT